MDDYHFTMGQAFESPMRSVGKSFPSNAATETEFAKIAERIGTAQKRLDDEINHLSILADKLFGERPEMESANTCTPTRSGRVGDVLDRLDGIHDSLWSLSSVVNRFGGLV